MTNPYNSVVNPYQTDNNTMYYQYGQPSQVPYNVQYNPYFQQPYKKTPSILGSGLLGLTGGGLFGYYKFGRPITKDGAVRDAFVKEAFNNYVKKGANNEYFKQAKKVLKKLDKVKTPEDFKKLLNKSEQICKKNFSGVPYNTVYDTVNSDNLNSKVSNLKATIEASLKHEVSNMKDTVKSCWDFEKRKFVKPASLRDNNIFESIKKTKTNLQWKKAGKYGGITGGIMAALALIYRIIVNRRGN